MSQSDCIFCTIINGGIPAAKVFESEDALAFLDIAPVSPGHALVIPKAHYETVLDIPAQAGAALLEAVQKVAKAVMEATDAHGFNLYMNTYEAAGQLVPHAHWHIIPRFRDDGLKLWPQAAYDSPEAMTQMALAIQNRI